MKNKFIKQILLVISLMFICSTFAQKVKIPKSYSNIKYKNGVLGIVNGKEFYPEEISNPLYTYSKFAQAEITGTTTGIVINFKDENISGHLDYGLIKTENIKYPLPIFFKRNTPVVKGKAKIKLVKLSGKYDFIGWEKT